MGMEGLQTCSEMKEQGVGGDDGRHRVSDVPVVVSGDVSRTIGERAL